MRVASELVRTVELEPIPMGETPPLRFRIEVHARNGGYVSRLLRLEGFRLQPSFPQREGLPSADLADEAIWIADESSPIGTVFGSTPEEVIDGVCAKLDALTSRQG